jgi:hypothetical protein
MALAWIAAWLPDALDPDMLGSDGKLPTEDMPLAVPSNDDWRFEVSQARPFSA